MTASPVMTIQLTQHRRMVTLDRIVEMVCGTVAPTYSCTPATSLGNQTKQSELKALMSVENGACIISVLSQSMA